MSRISELPILLTQGQAATHLHISAAWLERQRWLGEGPPYIRYGRAVRYDAAALVAWLDAHRVTTSCGEV